jgi:hypothetical protein
LGGAGLNFKAGTRIFKAAAAISPQAAPSHDAALRKLAEAKSQNEAKFQIDGTKFALSGLRAKNQPTTGGNVGHWVKF